MLSNILHKGKIWVCWVIGRDNGKHGHYVHVAGGVTGIKHGQKGRAREKSEVNDMMGNPGLWKG